MFVALKYYSKVVSVNRLKCLCMLSSISRIGTSYLQTRQVTTKILHFCDKETLLILHRMYYSGSSSITSLIITDLSSRYDRLSSRYKEALDERDALKRTMKVLETGPLTPKQMDNLRDLIKNRLHNTSNGIVEIC